MGFYKGLHVSSLPEGYLREWKTNRKIKQRNLMLEKSIIMVSYI